MSISKELEKKQDEFFSKGYYQINKLLLVAIGLWPFQSKTLTKSMLIVVIVLIHTIMIFSVSRMYHVHDNSDDFLECLPMFLFNVSAFIRHINTFMNANNTKRILVKMYDDWMTIQDSVGKDMLRKAAKKGRIIALAYAGYFYSFGVIIVIIPSCPAVIALMNNENITISYDFLPTPVYYGDLKENRQFFLVAIHVFAAESFNVMVLVSVGGIFIMSVQHVCGLYNIVGYEFEHCADGDGLKIDLYPQLSDDKPYKRIIAAIRKHNSLLEHMELIESTYTMSFIVLLSINTILISFTGFETIMHLDTTRLVLKYGTFTVGLLIHLFFECLQGQQILDVSSDLRNCALRACWYRMSMRSRVLLQFVIKRSEINSKITAGRMYTLSFESYCSILRTSMSYFTLLKSVQ